MFSICNFIIFPFWFRGYYIGSDCASYWSVLIFNFIERKYIKLLLKGSNMIFHSLTFARSRGKNLNLNLPGTPYTSERVLRGVRVEMARKKNMRENKMRDK